MGVTTDQELDVTTITQSNGAGGDGFDADILDVQAFFESVLCEYNQGNDANLAADANLARSIIPAGTAALRDFSYLAPEIPEFIPDLCVGCMTCVIQCPDTAILAKVIEEDVLDVRTGADRQSVGSELYAGPVYRYQKVLPRAEETRQGPRHVRHLHRPDQM